MSDVEGEPSKERLDRLLFAGLAGLSLAAVLQMADKQPEMDRLSGVALVCFAVALPFLVSSFLLEVARSSRVKGSGRRAFDLAGVLLALAGLALLFFHMHLVAGCAFLGSVVFCVVVVVGSLR